VIDKRNHILLAQSHVPELNYFWKDFWW